MDDSGSLFPAGEWDGLPTVEFLVYLRSKVSAAEWACFGRMIGDFARDEGLRGVHPTPEDIIAVMGIARAEASDSD